MCRTFDNIHYSLVQKSSALRSIPEDAEHSEFPLKPLNAVGREHQAGLIPKAAVPQLFASHEEMHSIFIRGTS